jgi:hypothetical protein
MLVKWLGARRPRSRRSGAVCVQLRRRCRDRLRSYRRRHASVCENLLIGLTKREHGVRNVALGSDASPSRRMSPHHWCRSHPVVHRNGHQEQRTRSAVDVIYADRSGSFSRRDSSRLADRASSEPGVVSFVEIPCKTPAGRRRRPDRRAVGAPQRQGICGDRARCKARRCARRLRGQAFKRSSSACGVPLRSKRVNSEAANSFSKERQGA